MWACVNLLAGYECIIFHNQPAVWCTRENEAAVALQMERRLAGENVFAWGFFFCGERQRLRDREGKRKRKRWPEASVTWSAHQCYKLLSIIKGIISIIVYCLISDHVIFCYIDCLCWRKSCHFRSTSSSRYFTELDNFLPFIFKYNCCWVKRFNFKT